MKMTIRLTRLALPLTLLAILTVLALTIAACGGSGGDAGSGGLKTYSNGQYRYSFQYPEKWELQEEVAADVSAGGAAAATVGVYDPDGAVAEETYIDMAQISVYELNVEIDASLMPDVRTEVEAVLASLESQAGDLETLAPLSETSINGMEGFQVTYSFGKNGAPVKSTLYFLFAGAMEYQVTVQAAEENWGTAKPIFDAIMASFKPTAG